MKSLFSRAAVGIKIAGNFEVGYGNITRGNGQSNGVAGEIAEGQIPRADANIQRAEGKAVYSGDVAGVCLYAERLILSFGEIDGQSDGRCIYIYVVIPFAVIQHLNTQFAVGNADVVVKHVGCGVLHLGGVVRRWENDDVVCVGDDADRFKVLRGSKTFFFVLFAMISPH